MQSKKLYANGKISQQALLEIKMRKSELEALLSNKEFEKKEVENREIENQLSNVEVETPSYWIQRHRLARILYWMLIPGTL